MAWYLHIDMDAFYASVEQAMNPALRGKPVIVGGRDGRGVVTSASYEARKFGVRSAMPGFRAKTLCPGGIFLPNRHKLYAAFSKRVFAILQRYSPQVEPISIDEGVVDLTGTERIFGPPLATADRMIRDLEKELGLPASAGLASRRLVAKVAATLAKPRGLLYIPDGCEQDLLAPLPVACIPGIGSKTQTALAARGIRVIGDLFARPELADRYLNFSGDGGDRRHDHSIGSETTLDRPLRDRNTMQRVLWSLVEEVGSRLRRERLYARCVTLKFRYANFETASRSRTLAAPTCFDREIFTIASELLIRHVAPDRLVRLLGVSLSGLVRSGWQEPLFGYERRRSLEALYEGIDRL
ncbi:MAG TPA: DNA polymerase IV, partial [Candidatus Eisenbacteria bacterium]|nr:DNA polymerase IV [Candidatus Eisenbacteria bacterium]